MAKTLQKSENAEVSALAKKNSRLKNFLCLLVVVFGASSAILTIQLKAMKNNVNSAVLAVKQQYAAELQQVNERINALEENAATLYADKGESVPADAVSANYVNQKIAALRQELQEQIKVKAAASHAADTKTTNERQQQEVLLASGAMVVEDLAEEGENFVYEAEVLKILAQGNTTAEKYVEDIKQYAQSGIAGKKYLIARFNTIFNQLNNTEVKTEKNIINETDNAKWYEKILPWLKSLVVVKKGSIKPQFEQAEDEVWYLVNSGNLREALNAMQTNGNYNRVQSKPLTEWCAQAEKYLEFKHAVKGLVMNCLANLHIKEMEH